MLMFLDKKDEDLMLPQLKDEIWKPDLTFLVDMLEHLKVHTVLQGKDLFSHNGIQQYRVSKQNLFLFSKQVKISLHIFLLYKEYM